MSELETLSILTAGKSTISIADIRSACLVKGSIYDLTESLKTRQYKSVLKLSVSLNNLEKILLN